MFWRDRVTTLAGNQRLNKDYERRGKLRFPMRRDLRYKLLKDGTTLESGTGQTCNIGSGGALVSIDREVAPGAFIQLSISWPVVLETGCPVRLIAFGRVLRSRSGECACTIDKYEFRTQARAPETTAARRDGTLERWVDTIRRESVKARAAV